jgi:hypothetical protein
MEPAKRPDGAVPLEGLAEFWKMIEERRREPTMPLDAVKAELFRQEDLPNENGSRGPGAGTEC